MIAPFVVLSLGTENVPRGYMAEVLLGIDRTYPEVYGTELERRREFIP